MKRVLMLATIAPTIRGFNMPNIALLQSMGYDVDVACNFKEGHTCPDEDIEKFKKRLDEINVHYYQIDFSRKLSRIAQNIKAIRQVINLAKKKQYSFIHCHTPFGGVAGRAAGKFTGTKVIYTAHGFHFFNGAPLVNWMLYYPVEKFLSRWTDILITINKEDYQRAKDHFYMKKLEYVPGVGIDLKKFHVKEDIAIDKRAELNISQNAKVLLSVGELNQNKNHELAIRALAKMEEKSKTKRGPEHNANTSVKTDIEYVIAGDGDKKEYLENLAQELGVKDRVHLIGYRKDVNELYKMADVFVFPSFREGLSVSLMEAMASSLPCVVSDIRGNKDLIQNGKGGYLCDPFDVNVFSTAIETLLSDEKKRAAMGKENIRQIQAFTLQNVNDNMRQLYGDIPAGGGYGGV